MCCHPLRRRLVKNGKKGKKRQVDCNGPGCDEAKSHSKYQHWHHSSTSLLRNPNRYQCRPRDLVARSPSRSLKVRTRSSFDISRLSTTCAPPAHNDLDELTAYSMDKDRGKIRVGPIVGLEFEKLEPMAGARHCRLYLRTVLHSRGGSVGVPLT